VFRCTCSNAVPGYDDVPAPVPLLLTARGPPAIAGFIIPVIVYPINRGAFWARSHILIEVSELLPPFADLNATSSVARVFVIVGIGASSKHAHPSLPLRGTGHPMLPAASTRAAVTIPKSDIVDDQMLAAHALTNGRVNGVTIFHV
jgi:hypothetical protein